MTSTEDGVERQVLVRLDVASHQVVDSDGLIGSVIPALIAWPGQFGHPVQSADGAADSHVSKIGSSAQNLMA